MKHRRSPKTSRRSLPEVAFLLQPLIYFHSRLPETFEAKIRAASGRGGGGSVGGRVKQTLGLFGEQHKNVAETPVTFSSALRLKQKLQLAFETDGAVRKGVLGENGWIFCISVSSPGAVWCLCGCLGIAAQGI